MNKDRFQALCSRHLTACPSTAVESWFNDIEAYYSLPERRYHTPEHVEHCLRQLDLVPDLIDDRDALEFAIWYHDAVYEFGQPDNELKSAQLFQSHVEKCMRAELLASVTDLIMVTVHGSRHPSNSDQEFMVDIDLSSFGLPWSEFLHDSSAVREESPHLSDDEFYPRQAGFLQSLLDRPHFCLTKFFRKRHEAQARDNIARYLIQLAREGWIAG